MEDLASGGAEPQQSWLWGGGDMGERLPCLHPIRTCFPPTPSPRLGAAAVAKLPALP